MENSYRAEVFLDGKYWFINFPDFDYWGTQACDNREVLEMARGYVASMTSRPESEISIHILNPEMLDNFNLSTPAYYWYQLLYFFYRNFGNGKFLSNLRKHFALVGRSSL